MGADLLRVTALEFYTLHNVQSTSRARDLARLRAVHLKETGRPANALYGVGAHNGMTSQALSPSFARLLEAVRHIVESVVVLNPYSPASAARLRFSLPIAPCVDSPKESQDVRAPD